MINKRAKGNIGEDIAVKFLQNRDFRIVSRNYLKKWGELDIVATKEGVVHFFEVKSVGFDYMGQLDTHHPEDNVHGLKVKHLRRIIETYLEEEVGDLGAEFEFHVLCVFVDLNKRVGKVRWMRNLII